jgi:indole-3-glycerol phosphate synthase
MGLLADMQRASAERVTAAKARVAEAELRAQIADSEAPPPLVVSDEGFDVIAELKLRSPSQGALARQSADPVAKLTAYAQGGAAAVSVLTEPTRFDGSLEHLRLAAFTLTPLGVPVMRKDFLVDPYQLLEARAAGASGALLIVRMVERARLIELLDRAAELELFVLLEAFDAAEVETAAEVAAARNGLPGQVLMGVNCRNLETLAIDPRRFGVLRDRLPPGWPPVAESGVESPRDAAAVAALGYRLALVGTSLMKQADAARATAQLIEAGRGALKRRRDDAAGRRDKLDA